MSRDLVLLVLDSCRYDSFVEAAPRFPARLGPVQRRWSYATWTSPAHFNLLMGLLPHPNPRRVFASAWYQQDLARWRERLGVDDVGFLELLPRLWLPHHLKHHLGYATRALVSMPVLHPATPLSADFDSYEKMERHDDLGAIIDRLRFSDERPTFWLLNTGETHYPYTVGEGAPHLPGVSGVMQRLGAGQPVTPEPAWFDDGTLERLRARQVAAVAHLDPLIERLLDCVPDGTWVIVTSDHGELFGEGGHFGHGPVAHGKVLEVPFVEGVVSRARRPSP